MVVLTSYLEVHFIPVHGIIKELRREELFAKNVRTRRRLYTNAIVVLTNCLELHSKTVHGLIEVWRRGELFAKNASTHNAQ